MADKLTPQQRSVNMRAIKSTGTKPEMSVRRMVHAMGYRYRLHRKDLPGRPDLVFPGRRKVIFVHGCFWHQHELEKCLDGRMPKSNKDYWQTKLERNVQRDRQNCRALEEAGWEVLVIWDCELKNLSALEKRLRDFLPKSG